MVFSQNVKSLVVIKQQSATNAATLTSDQIDTKGYDYLTVYVIGTTSNDATNNPATLRLTEFDTTVVSSFTAIAAFTGDGASGFTIPSSPTATTTAPFAMLNVDLKGRKRYITLEVSPVTTQTFTAIALLSRAEQVPTGTTNLNVAVVANG